MEAPPLRSPGRFGKRQWALKPQDLAVALKLAVLQDRLPYATLAEQLRLSNFETHAAATRLVAARLAVDGDAGVRPIMAALANFVVYGAPYAYPPVRGGVTIGFPTAYAVPPLKQVVLFSDETPPVWPHPEGTVRGLALLPLYARLPLAAQDDPKFYELLALFDALRIGQTRERGVAADHVRQRLR